jgi:hypothetical protein
MAGWLVDERRRVDYTMVPDSRGEYADAGGGTDVNPLFPLPI